MVITALCHHGSSHVWSGLCVLCIKTSLSLKYWPCIRMPQCLLYLSLMEYLMIVSPVTGQRRQIFDLSSVHQLECVSIWNFIIRLR